jgi:hypothetical protein
MFRLSPFIVMAVDHLLVRPSIFDVGLYSEMLRKYLNYHFLSHNFLFII